jgi:tetratricopeptide (TPR) repeat protein
LEECLSAVREIGDKRGEALARNNLGNIFYMKNDFDTAKQYYQEALKLGRETDDRYIRSIALSSLGITLFRQGELSEANSCYQESLALNREMSDKVGLSLIHCYLGLMTLVQGQLDTARKWFLDGLAIAHQNDIKAYVIYNLIGIADLWIHEGKAARSVTLLAAATAIASALGFKIEPELQEPYDRALAQARQRLSEEEFEAAWKTGQDMNVERAVILANDN